MLYRGVIFCVVVLCYVVCVCCDAMYGIVLWCVLMRWALIWCDVLYVFCGGVMYCALVWCNMMGCGVVCIYVLR